VLRQALTRRGIESFFADEVSLPGTTLAEALRESMAQADLVVCAFAASQENSRVFLELGVAIGMRKRALVLSPTFDILPGIAASGIPTIRATLQDQDRIEFGLRQVLAAPRKQGNQPAEFRKQTHPLGGRADELLKEVTPGPDSQPFKELVRKALVESGVDSLVEAKDEPLLAVWVDDLEPWVSNPLLIKFEAGGCGPAQFAQVIEDFEHDLASRGVPWGLLLHRGTLTPALKEKLKGSPVLALSASGLLEALKAEGFADIVLRLRNERVHGGA
jgi:hypothetical protein